MSRRSLIAIATVFLIAALAGLLLASPLRGWALARLRGQATVADVIGRYGASARERIAPAFEQAGVEYPPSGLTFAAIKSDRLLEVWAPGPEGPVLVTTYPVLAASGEAGPKLKEGDRQVPEGVYRIEGLNPNSSLHLSMKLDYPNAFDRARAEAEGRTNLGGNIFIHGRDSSVGCLAVGDPAIEELFVLVNDVGTANVRVIIAPVDPRKHEPPDVPGAPDWLPSLYRTIWTEFEDLGGSGTS